MCELFDVESVKDEVEVLTPLEAKVQKAFEKASHCSNYFGHNYCVRDNRAFRIKDICIKDLFNYPKIFARSDETYLYSDTFKKSIKKENYMKVLKCCDEELKPLITILYDLFDIASNKKTGIITTPDGERVLDIENVIKVYTSEFQENSEVKILTQNGIDDYYLMMSNTVLGLIIPNTARVCDILSKINYTFEKYDFEDAIFYAF